MSLVEGLPKEATDLPSLEALLGFAFVLGIASFFTPCAAGMVPAYLGYYLGRQETEQTRFRRIGNGALFGMVTTFGFVTLFGIAGAAFLVMDSSLRATIGPNLYILTLVVGGILIAIGIVMVLNIAIPFSLPVTAPKRKNIIGFYTFGVAYGVVSFSCNLPLFLAAISFALLAGGGVGAALVILAYALGKGTMMTAASLLVAVPKEGIDLKKLAKWTPKIKKVSGVAMIAAGSILIAYYAYLIWEISRATGGS